MKQTILCLFLFLLLACNKETAPVCNETLFSVFPPVSYVSDYASMLTEEEELSLIEQIKKVNKQADAVIAILIIDDIPDGFDISEFTINWADCYGIGEKGKNNGVALGVSTFKRSVFLAKGSGIEQRLTDEECAVILEEEINKNFRNGYYVEGLREAIEKIGEYAIE